MSRLRLFITSSASLLALLIYTPGAALAACSDSASSAIECGVTGANGGQGTPTDATASANSLITSVLNIITVVAGIIGVIMVIIAGYKYMTSSGNAEKVSSAKRTLMYAIIGLVIAALARIIVKFVLYKVSSSG